LLLIKNSSYYKYLSNNDVHRTAQDTTLTHAEDNKIIFSP